MPSVQLKNELDLLVLAEGVNSIDGAKLTLQHQMVTMIKFESEIRHDPPVRHRRTAGYHRQFASGRGSYTFAHDERPPFTLHIDALNKLIFQPAKNLVRD